MLASATVPLWSSPGPCATSQTQVGTQSESPSTRLMPLNPPPTDSQRPAPPNSWLCQNPFQQLPHKQPASAHTVHFSEISQRSANPGWAAASLNPLLSISKPSTGSNQPQITWDLLRGGKVGSISAINVTHNVNRMKHKNHVINRCRKSI